MSSAGGESMLPFWLAMAGLVAVICLGSAAIFWVRRWARGPMPTSRPGFSLEDLRLMYERGELTKREYDTARDATLHRARNAARQERQRRGGTDWSGPEGSGSSAPSGR